MAERAKTEAWLLDMDGVLVHEGVALPGAEELIQRLREKALPFLVLTNNSIMIRSALNRIEANPSPISSRRSDTPTRTAPDPAAARRFHTTTTRKKPL